MINKLDKLVHPKYNAVLIALDSGEHSIPVTDGETSFTVMAKDCEVIGQVKPQNKYDLLKMYVVVDREAPVGLGINGMVHVAFAAGAALKGHGVLNECIVETTGSSKSFDLVTAWDCHSYRNVSVTGTSEDIREAIYQASLAGLSVFEFHEPDWLESDGRPLAVAFSPTYNWPEVFSKFELHSGVIKRENPRPSKNV